MTTGWQHSIELSVNVKRWLDTGGARAEREFIACLNDHGESLGKRMFRGTALSPYRLPGGNRLVLSSRCSDRGRVFTTAHLKLAREGGRS